MISQALLTIVLGSFRLIKSQEVKMEYETREIWYMFEGGIGNFEIPYGNVEETRLENTNPAQTEHSPLVKAVKASE